MIKVVQKSERRYIIRLERGDGLMEQLRLFVIEEGIRAGVLNAIGACEYALLAFYSLGQKQYEDREYRDAMEILNITGNISLVDGEVFIHAHGTFADRDFKITGGHVKRLTVGATCEVVIEALDAPMEREMDNEIGLKLLKES